MRHLCMRFLIAVMLMAMLVCILPFSAKPAAAATMQYYTDYGTIMHLYNMGGCTGMQGMTVDDTYLYNVKVNSATEDSAFIARTHKDTGATVYLTDSSSGSEYFSYFGHANDLEIATIGGVDTILIATSTDGSYSLVRMALNGTTLTKVANYTTTYNGTPTAISSAKVLSQTDSDVTLLIKKGKYLYTATMGINATGGTLVLNHVFTLDTANVTINGVCYDFSDYLGQGFEYIDGKIFVPMACADPMNQGCIAVYNIEGASGTIRNDPTLSFWIYSSAYSNKFELESCAICPTDGILYFNTNGAITSSDGDYDGIHYVKGYVYDPSHGTNDIGKYRWEVQDDRLVSVLDGGCAWNNALSHQGTISQGTFTDGRYALSKSVILNHDEPWILEWKSSGTWTDGSLLFSSASVSKYEGNTYIFRRKNSSLIALGEYVDGTFYNYGVTLSDYGIDGTAEHVYSLRNRILSDGTNMVYLYVDGAELGPMINYHLAGTPQGTTSNWVSGKDFTFSYMGTDQHPLAQCNISYVQVWGKGLLDQADEPNIYRWETQNDQLISRSDVGYTANAPELLYGSCTDGIYTDAQFQLNEPVVLLHHRPWSIEWYSEGAWTGGSLLLAGAQYSDTCNSPILYRRQNSTLISLGMYDGEQFNNYGVNLSDHNIDGTVAHTYRLTNRIAPDGSNMVYLYVDGMELGAMNNYYANGSSQGITSDWLNGQDLVFSYIGTYDMPVNDCKLDYLQVWEYGIPSEDTVDQYLWETQNDQLTSKVETGYTNNDVQILSGSCNNGTYTGGHFALEKPVVLLHNKAWCVEWKSSGSWKDSANGSLLLCSAVSGNAEDTVYLYRRGNSEIIAFGERLNSKHHNYGIKLSDHGIDGTVEHIYQLVNKPSNDGSNMVYLYVDGNELGAMNQYYVGGVSQNVTSDWISGKDFVFPYLGAREFTIGNCQLDYLKVSENATATIEFRDWDGGLIHSCEYAYGSAVTEPDAPIRLADETYTYRFVGWDHPVEACFGGAVYTAVYEKEYINYTVIFRDWDGTVISEATYHYGDPVNPPASPVRAEDDNYTYQFVGWSPSVTACNGNREYSAVYEATAKLHPTIAPKYPTLSFEDEILINVYFTASDLGTVTSEDMGLLTWSTPQYTGTVDTAEKVCYGATYNSATGFYCVTSAGIPAKKLSDTVYFKIFVQLENGSVIYSSLLNYSPKSYADNILSGASHSVSLKTLVVSMLNYGTQAQTYFNYKPYNLMNSTLTAEQKGLPEAYRKDMIADVIRPTAGKLGEFAASGGFTKKYPTISFEGAFSINYYFAVSQTPADQMTFYYWSDTDYRSASVLTVDNATRVLQAEPMVNSDGSIEYHAVVDGIAAKDLDRTLYVAAVYDDGTTRYCSGVLAYSIGAYCVSQAGSTSAMKDFAASAAVYSYYAKNYFSA